jgi:undecaprenyl-diphosphatase
MQFKRGYWYMLAFALLGVLSFFFDRQILNVINLSKNLIFDNSLWIFDSYLIFILLVLLILGLQIKNKDKKTSFNFILAMILTGLLVFFIKLLVARERPFELVEYFLNTGVQDYSFPSNHTAIIFAMLPFLIKEVRKLKYFWIILAVLVAYSRLYFGMHYLSDVIFGALIGLGAGYYMLSKKESQNNKNKVKRKNKKKKL